MQKPLIEPLIASAYSEGRAWFGDLGLDPSTYAARIQSIVQKHLGPAPTREAAAHFVTGLHGRDLYLATACAQHSPGTVIPHPSSSAELAGVAWKALESTYKSSICDLVRHFHRTRFAANDLADNVIADLFLPDRSGASRIASYDGRSSLSTWLRVIICNRAINAQRSSAFAKSTELQTELPDESALGIIEMTLRAQRYHSAIDDSLAAACCSLSPRERLILLWRYEDRLQLGEIARLLGIHQSNVTRQLDRILDKLRHEVMFVLAARHGLSQPAIEECFSDIAENPRRDIAILDFVKANVAQEKNGLGPVLLQTNGTSKPSTAARVVINEGTARNRRQEKAANDLPRASH